MDATLAQFSQPGPRGISSGEPSCGETCKPEGGEKKAGPSGIHRSWVAVKELIPGSYCNPETMLFTIYATIFLYRKPGYQSGCKDAELLRHSCTDSFKPLGILSARSLYNAGVAKSTTAMYA